jgi:3-oxoacyl-[acyl-carrier protein] reductase
MAGLEISLSGKKMIIVGGVGTGIGREITRLAAASGAHAISVVGRNAERAEEAAAEVRSPSCAAFSFSADAASAEDAVRVCQDAAKAMGGLDILITVVGGMIAYAPWTRVEKTTDEDWAYIFDVNVNYVFRYVRESIKLFPEEGGAIVSVGSIVGATSSPMSVAYGAAKAGLMNMAKTVAAEYGRKNIRMNVVNCGFIVTDTSTSSDAYTKFAERIPMGRGGERKEVAALTLFLASPLASYVTGQTIAVDGGASSRFPLALPQTDPSMAG